MGAIFFFGWGGILSCIGVLFLVIGQKTKEPIVKKIMKYIFLICISLPISWGVYFLFFFLPQGSLEIYLLVINSFAILGILYMLVFKFLLKFQIDYRVFNIIDFFICISILSNPFPLALMIF